MWDHLTYAFCMRSRLTLILLTWRKGWTPNNPYKWQVGFNSAFKGLIYAFIFEIVQYIFVCLRSFNTHVLYLRSFNTCVLCLRSFSKHLINMRSFNILVYVLYLRSFNVYFLCLRSFSKSFINTRSFNINVLYLRSFNRCVLCLRSFNITLS